MLRNKKRLTIIVVPQVGRRTFSFQLSSLWLFLIPVLFIALGASLYFTLRQNEELRYQVHDLEGWKRLAHDQQTEIEGLTVKAQRAQERLNLLTLLEQQIRQLTQEQAPQAEPQPNNVGESGKGRGGPHQTAVGGEEPLPVLSTLLPPEARSLLFGPRPAGSISSGTETVADGPLAGLVQARSTNRLLERQLREMTRWEQVLVRGKAEVAAHLEYVAHRPTGLPVKGGKATDGFGWRTNPFGWGKQFHDGIDFAADYWAEVVSTAPGEVVYAGWKTGGYGYTVMIEHKFNAVTLYAHMIDWDVKLGQKVTRGQVIGWVGSSGISTGPHLHYEVHVDGVPVDPTPYLQ